MWNNTKWPSEDVEVEALSEVDALGDNNTILRRLADDVCSSSEGQRLRDWRLFSSNWNKDYSVVSFIIIQA